MEGKLEPVKIRASDTIPVGATTPSAGTTFSTTSSAVPLPSENLKIKIERGYVLDDPLGNDPILLRDPLSEVTRKERKAFLGLSILAIAVIKANLIPKEISAFGLKIDDVKRDSLIMVLTAMVLYFFLVFIVYAWSDFLAWRIAFFEAVKTKAHELELLREDGNPRNMLSGDVQKIEDRRIKLSSWSTSASFFRASIDFLLPVLVGGGALLVLRGCA